ncbi:hypothetical protein [Teredinibacter purpureus]|uniref:hypothetical protein n=1 Tax=Teredinibacter purpureus TaxID=2731756 RepID=UPI0005F89656|nr:hypothetical protein [Teredinibacter purpureus]
MNKILFALTLVLVCVAPGIASAVFFGKYFSSMLDERKEETRLQELAYSQLLLENIDAEKYASARERAMSMITASIFTVDPKNAYEFKYRDACLLHQKIYKYREEFPEKYIPGTELEENVQKILEMWSKQDCNVEPEA